VAASAALAVVAVSTVSRPKFAMARMKIITTTIPSSRKVLTCPAALLGRRRLCHDMDRLRCLIIVS
jgi:hypothetical protein